MAGLNQDQLGSLSGHEDRPAGPNDILKRPSPSDWDRLQPLIVAQYKRNTARMILHELHKDGFDVT